MPDLDGTLIQGINGDAVTAPPGAPSWMTPELIAHTIRVWQPYYSDSLTPDDAVTILRNVSELFGVLSRS